MIELNINNLSKYFGANKIFEKISFEIKTGEHIGLVGQNGCGKTTLMKILMGMEDYQNGEVSVRKECKLGYLDQIPEYAEGTTTMDVIQMAFESVYELCKRMEELEQQMANREGDDLEKAVMQYSRLQEQYELGGGYELETRICKITEGLKITENLKQMQFSSLSGGEKTRIILAKLLLEEPDILLLDEPTNHLDLNTILWLENFLKEYKGAALIISHDRYFLDHVISRMIDLNFDHAEVYLGNYSYYVEERERRFLIAMKDYENQQKKIDRMEQQIERFRIWGAMRDSEAMYKRAKVVEKRLDKIDVLNHPIRNKRKIRFNQTEVGRSGKLVIETTNLKKSYGDRTLIEDACLNVFYQDSICIIGENGCGKTTLLQMLLGEIEPDSGVIKLGSQVMIGYLPQHITFEDEEQTILEYFSRLHNIPNGEARTQLAKVLFFHEDVNKKIKILSGGEKSRLRLCALTFEGVNLLVLDEPTNHLDIASREVLEETLLNFEGTLLFVSHDRYFIDKIADKIIEIENCIIKEYIGDYQYYQEEVKKNYDNKMDLRNKILETKDKNNIKTVSRKKEVTKPDNEKKRNPRKIEQLELNIEEMEQKMKTLEKLIYLHNSDSDKLKEFYEEKEMVSNELEAAYTEWYNQNQI
jgi:ATPase subunit of ABC transporter with duplicated ATPase domains